MKRTVSFLAILFLFSLAASSMGGVAQTKHNFSSPSASPNAFFWGTRQVCVFCHTVHNADPAAGKLWNHETNLATSY